MKKKFLRPRISFLGKILEGEGEGVSCLFFFLFCGLEVSGGRGLAAAGKLHVYRVTVLAAAQT